MLLGQCSEQKRRKTLREALADDERVIVLGEDVADYGGTYAVTKGLHDEFGRVRHRREHPADALLGGRRGRAPVLGDHGGVQRRARRDAALARAAQRRRRGRGPARGLRAPLRERPEAFSRLLAEVVEEVMRLAAEEVAEAAAAGAEAAAPTQSIRTSSTITSSRQPVRASYTVAVTHSIHRPTSR